ncbi:Rieske (2Fe-2S) protein [Streptomyces sp. N2-109]|uniref:Rieske (2Fe-2S) protein n=1 Tax=Streptomyces gossypii TaxID=2883101 RepID=A0ABT2K3F8_9ACTN|nr:Rieske (2Fe-2S) protein [Streptomyces gossypii]MCT2594717.1 Rieske (2Fe-2S) protein [Streptomyces gossypii]
MTTEDTPSAVHQVTEDLVLVDVAGRRVLAAAHCPHRAGKLKFGHVDAARLRIRCPLHHATFDLDSGERVSGPACDPLRIFAVLPETPLNSSALEALTGAQPAAGTKDDPSAKAALTAAAPVDPPDDPGGGTTAAANTAVEATS